MDPYFFLRIPCFGQTQMPLNLPLAKAQDERLSLILIALVVAEVGKTATASALRLVVVLPWDKLS